MPPEEAKVRMRRMRRVVRRSDVHEWARAFLAALRDA
jgi:trehalose-6-phosphate synthase